MINAFVLLLAAAGAAAQTPAPAAPAQPSTTQMVSGQAGQASAIPPQAGQQPAPPPVILPPRVGVESTTPQALTIDDAVRMTLEHNNDVAIARITTLEARESIRAAQGVYDPTIVPLLTYQKATTASASTIGGATEGSLTTDTFLGNVGLAGRTPWQGGRYTVDFNNTRIETTNTLARLNPQFPTALLFSYTQPLFRGRSIDAERRDILIARRAADLTDAQLEQVLTDQLTLVEQAYWDLVFAIRNLDLQTTALSQAQTQVASNERQVQSGTLAPIDVVEAATQVANFRQSVASAQQALTEAENRLKLLMLEERGEPMWSRAILPTEPADRSLPTVTLEQAVESALKQRPELAELESARAQNAVQQKYFADQAKPLVNLVGSYNQAGLAGGILPTTGNTVPDFFVGGYGTSLGNLFARRFPTAAVQLQMSLPIMNTTARANVARTHLVEEQIDRQRKQLEQQIEVQVRNALQAVQTSQERLSAAASARRSAQEQYESEQRRFDSGLSTVFLVLERQTSLVTARTQELRSRADLNQAVNLLDRATGSTLQQHGVAFDPAATSPPTR